MITYIAEDAGIEFNTGTDTLKTDKPTQTKIDVIMKRLENKDGKTTNLQYFYHVQSFN